jgi:hypothetical protein
MHLFVLLATGLWCHQIRLRFPFGNVVHIRGCELPSADPSLKEDIKLPVDAALGFGKAQGRPAEEEGAGAGPEEACLGVLIPRLGAQHCGASGR